MLCYACIRDSLRFVCVVCHFHVSIDNDLLFVFILNFLSNVQLPNRFNVAVNILAADKIKGEKAARTSDAGTNANFSRTTRHKAKINLFITKNGIHWCFLLFFFSRAGTVTKSKK